MLRALRRLALLCLASPAALAWSALGHRLVGEIAERHLQPSTERRSRACWRASPIRPWPGSRTGPTSCATTIPRASGRPPAGITSTLAGTCAYHPARDCPDGNCVIAAIEQQRAILAERRQPPRRAATRSSSWSISSATSTSRCTPTTGRQGWQRFQVGLRTDMQPRGMRATARRRRAGHEPACDLGLLHTRAATWTCAITPTASMRAVAAGRRRPAPEAWAGESCRLVDARHLYPDRHTMDPLPRPERPLAEQRVRQAAYGLAALLDAALGH